jgi:hypothetical protein
MATCYANLHQQEWGCASPPTISNSYTKLLAHIGTLTRPISCQVAKLVSYYNKRGPLTQAAGDLARNSKTNLSIMVKFLSVAAVI